MGTPIVTYLVISHPALLVRDNWIIPTYASIGRMIYLNQIAVMCIIPTIRIERIRKLFETGSQNISFDFSHMIHQYHVFSEVLQQSRSNLMMKCILDDRGL
jgi:hypothetical protein